MELTEKQIEKIVNQRENEQENQEVILNSDLSKEDKLRRLRIWWEYFKLETRSDGKLYSYLPSERL